MTTISPDSIDRLRTQLRGRAITPEDPRYDTARTVWNAMIDRKPAIIVQCEGVSDVKLALAYGREVGLPIAVRGGGHNIAGLGVCDRGVVIDLSAMRSVTVEPLVRRAYVEPGATLRDVDHEAQAFGLATPLGVNSTTGVAGLVLGGGFGWLTRRYGMSIDNLLAAHVLTADGRLLVASAADNADLFWAIRGGGGNFGVVTRFELALHPVGPEVFAGMIVFPVAEAREVLAAYRAFVASTPDELAVWAVLNRAPAVPFLPKDVHGTGVLVLVVFHVGDVERGRSLVAPLTSFGTVLGQHVGPVPYEAWQQVLDPMLAAGARNYWKSHNLTELDDGVIDAVVDAAARLPHAESDIMIGQLGGQASRVPIESTAYAHRSTRFVINMHARWRSPQDDASCIGWARALFDRVAPFASGGAYVNFLTGDEADRVPLAYGPSYARLMQVKRRYDPDNLFCVNHNIRPAVDEPAVSARSGGDGQPSSRHP